MRGGAREWGTWLGTVGVVAAVVGLASMTPGAIVAQSSNELPEVVELPAELDIVLRDYEEAWMAGDAVALADLFTEDGFVLRPGRPPSRGREAILGAYRNAGGHLTLTAYDYAMEGRVGYIIGAFAVLPAQPPVGKFVLALRRDSSGTWLIVGDIDNGNE